MLLSNSVLRRYTPPTCTLEIVSRSSPLSRWMGRSVLKQLRFELCFDDPRLPEEQRVSIHGDRDQLEILQEAVTNYVQDLLNSPDQFNAVLSGASDSAVSTPQALDVTNDSLALSESPQSVDAASIYLSVEDAAKKPTATRFKKIFLQPDRGLSHNLFLGSLAGEGTGSVIRLSVLQLFDLATALDEYATDAVALPTLNPTRSGPARSAWTSIAAVLLLAVGLTTMMQLLNRSNQRQQTATTTGIPGSNNQQPIALQPSPIPPLSSLQLPPPPPPGSIRSPNSVPPISLPGTNPALPGAPKVNAPPTTPTNSSLRPTPQQIIIKPTPGQSKTVLIPGENARTSGGTPNSVVVIPNINPQITPRNPNSEASLPQATRSVPPTERSSSNSPVQSRTSASEARPSAASTTPNQSTRTASSTIPQVAEARTFFQQRWQPPSSLKQTLEYSLLLDVDGTIQRIEPLGQAARTYIDETGMPLIGERFVSPIRDGQTPRIRLVLAPDGKVQVFREEISN